MRWESRFKVFYEYETTGDLAYEINCSVPNSWTQPIDVSISLLFFKDEKLARVIDGREIVYDYDDCGRIIKISVSEAGQRRLIARENYDRAKSVLISDVKERVSRVSYDASGLSEITECIRELDITNEPPVGAPKHTLVYKRRPSGATLSKVLVEIKDRLRELVVEMVEGYPSEDRLVAVCLMYEEGSSWPCPPYITVCSQESRESLMASGCSVWLGAEFSEPLKLPEDQRFDELCRLACEFIHLDNKWTSLKKCLFELAGELNDYEWKPAKKFSPEFVVFVAEARQRFNSLKSSTPQRKADILKRLNLL